MATFPGGQPTLISPVGGQFHDDPSLIDILTNLNDEVMAITAELGTNPAGSEATVDARLVEVEGGASIKDVTTLGVDNTGVSDIGPAMAALLATAQPGRYYLPEGTYVWSSEQTVTWNDGTIGLGGIEFVCHPRAYVSITTDGACLTLVDGANSVHPPSLAWTGGLFLMNAQSNPSSTSDLAIWPTATSVGSNDRHCFIKSEATATAITIDRVMVFAQATSSAFASWASGGGGAFVRTNGQGHVVVKNSVFAGTRRPAIEIEGNPGFTGVSSTQITNNNFVGCWSGVDISAESQNVTVSNNAFNRCLHGVYVDSGIKDGAHSTTIVGNTFTDYHRGVDIRMSDSTAVVGNTFLRGGYHWYSATTLVPGFGSAGPQTCEAVSLWGARGCTITGNTIDGFNEAGGWAISHPDAVRFADLADDPNGDYSSGISFLGSVITIPSDYTTGYWAVGDNVEIVNSANNDGTYSFLSGIDGTSITVAETFVTESAGASVQVRVRRGSIENLVSGNVISNIDRPAYEAEDEGNNGPNILTNNMYRGLNGTTTWSTGSQGSHENLLSKEHVIHPGDYDLSLGIDADWTVALQWANDRAVSLYAGGVVQLPPFQIRISSDVLLDSFITLRGYGESSIIRVLDNAAASIKSRSFDAESISDGRTGTDIETNGEQSIFLSDFVFHGNRLGDDGLGVSGGSGDGLAIYGAHCFYARVLIRDCTGRGLLSEWGSSASAYGPDGQSDTGRGLESVFTDITIMDCELGNMLMAGPHDSIMDGFVSILQRLTPNGQRYGLEIASGGSAFQLSRAHLWGGDAEHQIHMTQGACRFSNVVAEGAQDAQLWIQSSGGLIAQNMHIFGQGDPYAQTGIRFNGVGSAFIDAKVGGCGVTMLDLIRDDGVSGDYGNNNVRITGDLSGVGGTAYESHASYNGGFHPRSRYDIQTNTSSSVDAYLVVNSSEQKMSFYGGEALQDQLAVTTPGGLVTALGLYNLIDDQTDVDGRTETGISVTLELTDSYSFVQCSNVSPITVTIPDDATMAVPNSAHIDIIQAGTGSVTVVGDGGVTLNNAAGANSTANQWEIIRLVKTGADEWTASVLLSPPEHTFGVSLGASGTLTVTAATTDETRVYVFGGTDGWRLSDGIASISDQADADVDFDIKVDGSIVSSATIASGSHTVGITGLPATVANDSYITLSVTAVGATYGNEGQNLHIQLRASEY